ncbi:MAG: class C sortase [Oscillospiraceae bacterium]|nr:class C sortase [Oscillospiraceae bacterium]
MKKHIFIYTGFALAFLVFLSVLLYPRVAKYVNARSQSRIVVQYLDKVSGMDEEEARVLLEAAREYNESLLEKAFRFEFTPEETARYKSLLDPGGGVMGILEIGKIDVKLPIYHGTDESVLAAGIGHLPGSSLPVGGTGTHAVITGHRGLPSSKLLSSLDKIAEGDTFLLHVLGETLTYQVDDIKTVEPNELRALDIDPDLDFCTLVTCTPYGVNTHRLLVRGQRVETLASPDRATFRADARRVERPLIILLFLVPALPVLVIFFVLGYRKIRKGGVAS